MSVELLYTSAPKGLKRGSRGFCTVLTTQNTPANLVSRLQSLSGYRQIYDPSSPHANMNPVAYSHLRIQVAGKPVSVLSRISAYGTDYSNRSNKLAHHVVPDANELGLAGPAWIMMQPNVMRSSWSGECETPERGPLIPMGDQAADTCPTWKRMTGDAGWGGIVADAFTKSQNAPTWIIYRSDQQNLILPLINESIALLPSERRWDATFSTYATNIPPNADCRVRCALEGTEEARFAAVKPTTIDLTRPMPPASGSVLTQQARGIRTSIPELPTEVPVGENEAQDETDDDRDTAPAVEINLDDEPDVMPLPPAPPVMTQDPGEIVPPPIKPPSLPPSVTRAKKINWLLPVVGLSFVIVVATAAWWIGERVSQGTPVRPPEQDAQQPFDGDMELAEATRDNTARQAMSPPFGSDAEEAPIEPSKVDLVMRYHPDQFADCLRATRDGGEVLGERLTAMGRSEVKLSERKSFSVRWQDQTHAIGFEKDIEVFFAGGSPIAENRTVRDLAERASYSGATIRPYLDEAGQELIFTISIDPSRKYSLLSDQIDSFKQCAESLVLLRAQIHSISALTRHLPEGTKYKINQFLERVPKDDLRLAETLGDSPASELPSSRGNDETPTESVSRSAELTPSGSELEPSEDTDSPPDVAPVTILSTLWTEFEQLSNFVLQLSGGGGPVTWSKKQREALLTVAQSIQNIQRHRSEFSKAMQTLRRGQKLSVPNLYFFDARDKMIAAYEIRLIVSW